MDNYKKYINKQKGYALTIVLLVMVVLSLLFVAAYTIVQSNTREIVAQESKLRAHYFARSGATLAYTAIIDEGLLTEFDGVNYNSEVNSKQDVISFIDEDAKAEIYAWHEGGDLYIKSRATLLNSATISEIYLKFSKNSTEMVTWLDKIN